MNILSLFDGISGARIALEKLNIPIPSDFQHVRKIAKPFKIKAGMVTKECVCGIESI